VINSLPLHQRWNVTNGLTKLTNITSKAQAIGLPFGQRKDRLFLDQGRLAEDATPKKFFNHRQCAFEKML
jgi:hypothetical protein